jgi:asparagine synthase (glutamine-hydrolysing)
LRCEQLRRLGGGVTGALAQLGAHLPSARARRLAQLLAGPLEESYRGVSRAFDDRGRARLWSHDALPSLRALLSPHWGPSRGWSPLRRMLYLDSRVWLPDDLLLKADKMTMAHAVELRVPFLDHPLVEHVWSLPDTMKVRGGDGKVLLRLAARGRVPRFVLERAKRGFATPTGAWLRTGMRELLHGALLGPRSLARDRFDLRYVERLLERHRRGADLSTELWPLLVLELWHSAAAVPRRRATRAAEAPTETRHAAS